MFSRVRVAPAPAEDAELPWVQETDTKGDKMTRTSRIVDDVQTHYNHLTTEHRKLHDEIEQSEYWAPDADLKHLKQRKLKIKDELEMLKTKLKTYTN